MTEAALHLDGLLPRPGADTPRRVAHIAPEACVGCTKCITACPFDSIMGAPKRMHTVIDELCTGCGLCLPACPVDCMTLAVSPAHLTWTLEDDRTARARFARRIARAALDRREAARTSVRRVAQHARTQDAAPPDPAADRRHALIEAAMRRASERLAQRDTDSPAKADTP